MAEVPVLIVGGGPVGMTLGLLLDRLGLESVIVERDESTTEYPKARGCSPRTMEIFRILGIEDRIRARGLSPDADAIWIAESGTGPILGVPLMEPPVNSPGRHGCLVTQELVERELADAVEESTHCTMRFSTDLVDFTQDGDGVLARIRNVGTGEEHQLRAQFLIGCDGGGSTVRQALGMEMTGPVLGTTHTYFYRTDPDQLPPYVGRVAGIFIWPSDPAIPPATTIAFTGDCTDQWTYFENVRDPDQPYRDEDEVVAIVRSQWGIPDLKVELMSQWRWRISAWMTDTWRSGRVLLAGDAAHVVPPAGGMGMNSGIADALNLGWKLVLATSGVASDRLLDTFEVERRPVIDWIIEWATGNAARILMRLPQAAANRHEDPQAFRDLILDFSGHTTSAGVSMGYVYEHGAVIDDGSPVPERDAKNYWPSDRPGARFPHMWVRPPGEERASTIDWFGTSFVLVCGPNADGWREAGASVAASSAAPLTVETLPDLVGPISMGAEDAVLVRPDGHVAWRPGAIPSDKAEEGLRGALDFLLAGGTEAVDATQLTARHP